MKKIAAITVLAIGFMLSPVFSDGNWVGPASGGTWGDDSNWGGGVEPTLTDPIGLAGADVTVDTVGFFQHFSISGGGTVTIDSGGSLTSNSTASYTILRRLDSITVNNGGSLTVAESADARAHVTVNSGGVFDGLKAVYDGHDVSIAGLWTPLDSIDGSNEINLGSNTTGGDIYLLPGGEIQLDIFGNNTNEYFNFRKANGGAPGSSGTLDLSNGTVSLTPQGYTPMVGDSFDLWETFTGGDGGTVLGTGSNISLSGYTLDISAFSSTGVVTVSGAAIPEPGSLMLFGMASLLSGILLKFRR